MYIVEIKGIKGDAQGNEEERNCQCDLNMFLLRRETSFKKMD